MCQVNYVPNSNSQDNIPVLLQESYQSRVWCRPRHAGPYILTGIVLVRTILCANYVNINFTYEISYMMMWDGLNSQFAVMMMRDHIKVCHVQK